LLVFLVLVLCFRDVGTLLAFRQNQERIVEKFCENRDRPAMKCNGACYLRKQMAAEENQEGSQRPPRQYEPEAELVWVVVEGSPSTDLIFEALYRHPSDELEILPDPYLGQVFHPPRPSTI
jgi:hypothetical protein